ncbi:type II secretion system protein, partial [Anaerorhabdus sp.]
MNNKRKNGFTLIELIVVIAILAVLGMLLVPQISGYIDASQSATCANNRKLIERSIALSEANDVDPTTLTTLDAIKAANGSIYKGGEVCPKNGKISINNRKVTCELHKD